MKTDVALLLACLSLLARQAPPANNESAGEAGKTQAQRSPEPETEQA